MAEPAGPPPGGESPRGRFGFNLVGFATANLGHGVALRNTAALLEGAGFDFDVIDLDPGGNRTGHDLSLAGRFLRAGTPTRFPVNLFHLNPPSLESLFRDLPDLVPTAGRMNVSVLFWELARLPLAWRPMLEAMDLVLAPTRFIGNMLDEAVRSTPWLYYRQTLAIPQAGPERARWGFPEGETVFLFSFDIASGIQRKHPLAAVEAFQRAFPRGGARLVLKVNNRDLSAEAGLMVQRVREAAARVPGIEVLDRTLAYGDLISLYASIDVLVSLHRGEGLGLSLMEAMALGKPVIATAWSGNMDFMDETNACLVPYRLVPPEPGTQYHALSAGVDQAWADPDLAAASRWMARLAESPELRSRIGERAKASMSRFLEEARRGQVFHRVREIHEAGIAPRPSARAHPPGLAPAGKGIIDPWPPGGVSFSIPSGGEPMQSSTRETVAREGGFRWSIVRLKEGDRAGARPAESRPREGLAEILEMPCRRDEDPRTFLAALWNILADARGEYVRLEGAGVEFPEEARAASEDYFHEGGEGVMAVAWSARRFEARGDAREVTLTPARAAAGFPAAVEDCPDLADPVRLLSLFAFRTRQLREWLTFAKEVPLGSPRELSALLFQVYVAGNDRVRYPGLPKVILGRDPSWSPAPDVGTAADAGRRGRSFADMAGQVDSIPGCLRNVEAALLFDRIQSLPDGSVVLELGCGLGRATAAMAFACAGTGKRIFAVDTFEEEGGGAATGTDFQATWRGNLRRLGLERHVTGLKGHSQDVLAGWTGPLVDFVLLDASRDYVDVLRDFQRIWPLVRPGGLIAIHDVAPDWPGPFRLWEEYGIGLLTDREVAGTLACGRKPGDAGPFDRLDARHADFTFAGPWREHLARAAIPGSETLLRAMEVSLAGRQGTDAEREALHDAELAIGRMPPQRPFRETLRAMVSRDARIDGLLLLWNAMTLMAEAQWREAYLALVESTRVSRPMPVGRIQSYCRVLKERMGESAGALPVPGAPHLGSVSADAGGAGGGAGHYGRDYFDWQKRIGAFGGVANLFKFRDHIRPTDTVVDLGSGGGFLLANVSCARKLGVEINPSARRAAAGFAGIDTVEKAEDLPDDFADVIISNHALEHMHGPLDRLKAILPKLKRGGRLVVVVPNDPPQQAWDPQDINKHLYTWNPMTLGNLVSEAGYRVESVEAIQHQWPPDFVQVYERLGEDGFHAACREQARRTGNHQIRVVAVR